MNAETTPNGTPPLLDVVGLTTRFPTPRGTLTAVDDVSFQVQAGEVFGLVGESGSGKTATIRSILGLVPPPGRVAAGSIRFNETELARLDERKMRRIRGREIAMIFQDPGTALNPVVRVETQLVEMLTAHGLSRGAAARKQAADLLRAVGIPAPEQRLRDYPHQLSGGMAQRVVIAIAIAANPSLLLADEPTTALDVTIQDQILSLLLQLQAERGMSMILVTHNLGVVAETCDRVGVMYAGQMVEVAPTKALLAEPKHPYTLGLLSCVPRVEVQVPELRSIPGSVADLLAPPTGCRFHPRCPFATDRCRQEPISLQRIARDRWTACIHHAELPRSAVAAAGPPRLAEPAGSRMEKD